MKSDVFTSDTMIAFVLTAQFTKRLWKGTLNGVLGIGLKIVLRPEYLSDCDLKD